MSPDGGVPGSLAPLSPRLLVVDDERNIRRTLTMVLEGEGYRVVATDRGEEALVLLGQEPIDLVVLDLKLPGMGGLEVLQKIRDDDALEGLPVIVISGHATVTDAVNAVKLGASDFFEKPLARERILVGVGNALRAARLASTVELMRRELAGRYEMIGTSPVMAKIYRDIEKVAPTKASVLVTGESGTGKELVCRAIHQLSPRADAPFVKVNCAAIPRELIESELFGHERGSFTGAHGRKRGFFEQAHGGTLFLDEIGDMEPSAQAKVLRALQNGEVSRVGSEQVIHVDVRVLAATNKDLHKEVAAGAFREDLLYRLDVFPIRAPALRERRGDVRQLARAFIEKFCRENGLRPKGVDEAVFVALERRSWPGNVRELKNVVERAAILSEAAITIADLPEDPHESPFDDEEASTSPGGDDAIEGLPAMEHPDGRRRTLREYREAAERGYILATLHEHEWNISRAALALGIERTNLHKKIRSYKIRRDE